MDITLEVPTRPYDSKKFGTPWIAKTIFDFKSQPIFCYGAWTGIIGRKGRLTLAGCKEHDIVAIGIEGSQDIHWYEVTPFKRLSRLETKYIAYIHYLMRPHDIKKIEYRNGGNV